MFDQDNSTCSRSDEQAIWLRVKDPLLDRLLRGGFRLPHDPASGLVVLIRGKPGTGKSTLALQLLDLLETDGAKKYLTLEQSKTDVQYKLNLMRVARALDAARTPNSEKLRPHGVFEYDEQAFCSGSAGR
ncbi:MAG: DUF2075 domain-containing protein [Pirellulaceae bacterium]|nr:DUF2075 domain-containing protein [Pirellulaceae bacterium]